MADDGFTVRIDDELAGDVRAAAAAKGVPVEMFVRDVLADHLQADMEWSDDPDPAIDERIARDTLRRGDGIPWEQYRERFKSFGRRPE
jgi:hypothetical protein